ncbi:putative membrane protein [Actinoplanes lutulentus]|uniref:Uncharacterized protein n=1 Tax=Actinoplanes lutulentus TaxID=1287878 RepID=A0A327YVJ7_9ACTN|nr:hypothetical protein [Actinoplanes lutulentus]MBB2940536.1 putative membrane protein [Actinoplanes lutulentus]RAK24806.1 hypothetical protein B0I29_13512 [Actinoplanes lutulentus]
MNSGTEAKIEFQRLVGKFSLFFAFIYFLMIVGSIVTVVDGDKVPVLTWVGIVLAGIVFVPAVMDAVRLHRTSDQQRLAALWRRCALLTLAGLVVMIATAVAVEAVYS